MVGAHGTTAGQSPVVVPRLTARRGRRGQAAAGGGVALLAAAVAGIVLACASALPPPGGPLRKDPPDLIDIKPDSNAVNVRTERVVFQFDEVVSERSSGGGGDLAALFLISPSKAEPDVAWHRDHIALSPKGGFRPNTVYTVTMLPGIIDLHGNPIKKGAHITFSTGPTIPATTLRGHIFDWVEGRPLSKALIEAIQRPIVGKDTVDYVTVADSTGGFALDHLPPGHFTVRGFLDANNNRRVDPDELWDSVSVALTDSATIELLAFVHDTIGPRVRDLLIRDSVTLRLTFDRGVDLNQPITTALFRLTAKDSSQVPIVQAQTAAEYDSVEATRQRARSDSVLRADSIRRVDSGLAARDTTAARRRREVRQARLDSIARARVPHPSRPSPPREAVLTLGAPLKPGASYKLHVEGLRGILGASRPSDRTFTVPKPSADSARADSARRRTNPRSAPPLRPRG